MNTKYFKTFALAISILFLFVGCNSSSNNDNNFSTTNLSGIITYEDGTPIANASVVAMDRKDNQGYKTKTDSEGHYSLSLPHGNYDLGSGDANGKEAIIKGPIYLKDATQESSMKLPSQQVDNTITGILFTIDHAPASNYRLHITSSTSRNGSGKLDINTTTDLNGMFSAIISGQHDFDLNIYDSEGNFVEFVDLHKLNGGLYTLLTLSDNENKNIHHYDEPSLSTSQNLSRTKRDNTVFSFKYDKDSEEGTIYDGELTVGGSYLQVAEVGYNIDDISKYTQLLKVEDSGGELNIILVEESHWWYDYKIIFRYGPLHEEREYYFTDKTGDVYSKDCIDSEEHSISFNSDNPTMIKIVAGYPSVPPTPSQR